MQQQYNHVYFFKQKTAYEMRISDWSSDVCSSDLTPYWTSYVDIADIVGAKVQLLPCGPEQNYKLTPAQLDAALAGKPKVFLFNNPSNPTGMVYTGHAISALADVLVRHPDTWIITDDIYKPLAIGRTHV